MAKVCVRPLSPYKWTHTVVHLGTNTRKQEEFLWLFRRLVNHRF